MGQSSLSALLPQTKGLPKQPKSVSLLVRLGQTFAARGELTSIFTTGTSLVPLPSLPVSSAP